VLARVPVTGRNPDAIVYEPSTRRVFTFNGGSANATVIDAATNKVVGTVALSGKPEAPAVDGKGTVFVNIEDKSTVAAIDAATLKVKAEWPLAPGEEPSGLALDPATRRLFSVCSNKLMIVLDADTGKIVATLPIGERVDGAAFDPGLKRAYSSNGDGTLTVVQEVDKSTFKVLENVATQRGARTLALDVKTHHIYLSTAEFGPTPAPTADRPRPRPTIVPGSFVVLDVAPAARQTTP
jgi:YVTN family beta-propeller protein